MNKKDTLVLCGFMASGKSTLGQLIAKTLGFDFVDTDDMLLSETGMTLPQMFAIGGESYFRDREHEIIRKAAALRRTVISTGGGVMTFERNARLLAENGEVIHIRRPFEDCYASILKRTDRPIASRKTPEEMRQMYDTRIAAYERYASLSLPNAGTPEEALAAFMAWYNA